jgi:hypothetical protein
MEFEGKQYTSEGWFSGLPGDETKYTLLFDENYDCFISPMEIEEAEYVWKESQAQQAEEIKKGGNKAIMLVGLATATYVAYRTGALKKAGNWLKNKFKKQEEEAVIIDHK